MMKIGIILLVFLAFMCNACEEIVDFPETRTNISLPVIESVLTSEFGIHRTRVTMTASVLDSVTGRPVDNAVVRVISSTGDTMNYKYSGDGWYESIEFAAQAGYQYTLEVRKGDTCYRSTDEVMPMNGISALRSKYTNTPGTSDSAWYIYMDAGIAYPDNPRYYLINLTVNGKVITHGADIWIFYDLYSASLHNIKLPRAFEKNDTVSVELNSLSKNMFDYYFKLAYEVFFLDISHISYRANLPQLFQPRALGYFQVSAADKKTIIVR